MKLNKASGYVLLRLLNGDKSSAEVGSHLKDMEVRTIQRALGRLAESECIRRDGPVNKPVYEVKYDKLLTLDIPEKLLIDENRPETGFNFGLMNWMEKVPVGSLEQALDKLPLGLAHTELTKKDLEYLTIELSWKSSALEGNTYTLLDTRLLLTEGLKAGGHTEFETQMILNHKEAMSFIAENKKLFENKIAFSALNKLHGIIGKNLGFSSGIRRRLVRVSASNYLPLSSPHQLREQADLALDVISRQANPVVRSLLALAVIPYLQLFEDGNKRVGRVLANAILISSVGRGFSLRKVDARELALAYLSFYEFGSMNRLIKIVAREL